MAKIIYTDHARFRMAKRGISHTDIQKVLEHPESKEPHGEEGKWWVTSTVDGRTIKVLIKALGSERILVITAFES